MKKVTKTKVQPKKKIVKAAQPKKEYVATPQPKKETKEIRDPDACVSVCLTRANLHFLSKKLETSNAQLSEYFRTILKATETVPAVVEAYRNADM